MIIYLKFQLIFPSHLSILTSKLNINLGGELSVSLQNSPKNEEIQLQVALIFFFFYFVFFVF